MEKKVRTPKEILEGRKDPHIEEGYVTSPSLNREGKEMVNVNKAYSAYGVKFDYDKINEITEKGEGFSTLHTHPKSEEDLEWDSAMYSKGDLIDFFSEPRQRAMKVAQQDPRTGKISGYLVMRKTKRTPSFPSWSNMDTKEERDRLLEEHPELQEFVRDAMKYASVAEYSGPPEESYGSNIQRAFNSFADKYGLTVSYLPEKGYHFKEGRGFVKKKDLGSLVASLLLFASAFILFSSFSFTGNIINSYPVEFSLGGIILLIGGSLLLYFSIRNK